MATEIISLLDYSNDRENVVIWIAGIGHPTGISARLGDPDQPWADELGLYDFKGTVDADGRWQWDGQGSPKDERNNSILQMTAHVHAAMWAELQGAV